MIASDRTTPLFNKPPDNRWDPLLRLAAERGTQLEKNATDWIRQHPALSLGLAVVLGVTLGWITKRR